MLRDARPESGEPDIRRADLAAGDDDIHERGALARRAHAIAMVFEETLDCAPTGRGGESLCGLH